MGFDKRVVVKLVVDVALDCSGVSLHLKQDILLDFISHLDLSIFESESYPFRFMFNLNPVNCEPIRTVMEGCQRERSRTNIVVSALQQVSDEW